MALRAHYSASTLADAASGRRLPSLEVALAYVRACAGDVDKWEERWHDLAAATVAERTSNHPVPYVGLTSFGSADAEWFFGRDRLTAQLRSRVSGRRFVAVFGASGSGKSSLLAAGLVAAVQADGAWSVTMTTPGPNPELPAAPGRLLVVDQFEEIFTLCPDPEVRSRFVADLVRLSSSPDHDTHVVIAVRADFYLHCSAHPQLVEAFQDAQFLVGPMTTDELRAAIVEPATRAGCVVEGSLVTELVAETAGQSGVLPLVSHALLETFHRRRGNTLTLAAYQAVGGMRGAAARTAEDTYTALTGHQQSLAKDLFLRLTASGEGSSGEGTEDVKRKVSLAELDEPDLGPVLNTCVAARLITVDGDTVEIAHEALIRSWPRLRDWLAQHREDLSIHRQLTEATTTWESLDHDPGALYRGTRLETAEEWATTRRTPLNRRERIFLETSSTAARTERRRTLRMVRQLRWLALSLAALLVVALTTSVVAVSQREEAQTQQRIALSRQLAVQAQEVAPKDAGKAIRWAVEAYAAHPTTEARSAVLSLASRPSYTARLERATAPNWRTTFSLDGRLLPSLTSRNEVLLWDATRRAPETTLLGLSDIYLAFQFDAASTHLAAAGRHGEIRDLEPHLTYQDEPAPVRPGGQ